MKATKDIVGRNPQHSVRSKNLDYCDGDALIIGGGGREHAIAKALSLSPHLGHIYVAPGNDGMISSDISTVNIAATDIDGVLSYLSNHPNVVFTFVAPDDPLALGMVDRLLDAGYTAFGPRKNAAKLEWSKSYAKDFMRRYNIPTAEYKTFSDVEAATEYVKSCALPVVLKADGLALGKGVLICKNRDEALDGVKEIMLDKKFGSAGDEMVVEQFLTGYEVSLLAFVDGNDYALMPSSCDHKRAFTGDEGLNTGGMGAFCPCDKFGPLIKKVENRIVRPTILGMQSEGAPFKGVLYFGLIVNGDDVKVLEYNARFGDPETQAILPLLKSDLYEICTAVINGTLSKQKIEWKKEKSINVILASGGYPLEYKKGYPISGISDVAGDVNIYFSGVKKSGDELLTNGGRVLCLQAAAKDFKTANDIVYGNIDKVTFENCFYRRDIGKGTF